MNDPEVNLDNILLEAINTTIPAPTRQTIIDILTILENTGIDHISTDLSVKLTAVAIADSSVPGYIISELKAALTEILMESSIGLNTEANLLIYKSVLLTLYTIANMDDVMKITLLPTLENDELSGEDKFVSICMLLTEVNQEDITMGIDYISNRFIDALRENISDIMDDAISEDDIEDIDTKHKLITGLINIDTIMASTSFVRALVSGEEINTNLNDNLYKITNIVNDIKDNPRLFAAEVATILFQCGHNLDNLYDDYTTYIEDNLLESHTLKELEQVGKYIQDYLYKIKEAGLRYD